MRDERTFGLQDSPGNPFHGNDGTVVLETIPDDSPENLFFVVEAAIPN